ncbi:MAG: hypothetical protein IPN49_18705 [Saprospiraceae bacterium]|nr:hypothetical protein [Saprospiraceae bacterium]
MEVRFNNTTGSGNVFLGTLAAFYNTERSDLVAVGDSALYFNGFGAVSADDGTFNTAVGSRALKSIQQAGGEQP